MAGLGETCTHIASVLFYLESYARLYGGNTTCTQEACQWIIPSYLKEVEYLPVKEIDFSSVRGKKRKVDGQIQQATAVDSEIPLENELMPSDLERSVKVGARSTESELLLLFNNLSVGDTKPGVLSVVPNHSDKYVPKSMSKDFPIPLISLKETKFVKMDYHKLLAACQSVSLCVTQTMADSVEEATRDQSKSRLWFKYRAGRITASRMKAVCHTNADKPSQSLIKTICYPEAFSFNSKATSWGCQHEKQARDIYFNALKGHHDEFSVTDSGLVINSQWPYVGASPDGIVECKCHGKGVLEIKCPFCHKESTLKDAAVDREFCLKQQPGDGQLHLDPNHAYYYQIQTQLFVCNVEYADFCVCTFMRDDSNSYDDSGIHIERIERNPNFWDGCIEKAQHFFKISLLPELMGNWYTRPVVKDTSNETDVANDLPGPSSTTAISEDTTTTMDQPTYCYCQGPEEGTMIACDNPQCSIEWFHKSCLQMSTLPKGRAKWYCPDCRKLPQFLKKKKGI